MKVLFEPVYPIWFIAIQLVVALLLGGVLGWERERHGRPAGLRTHMMLCLGSALFTIISISFTGNDPSRIAAQIVTGIGFIGAGSILRQGSIIRGLTSAATLWAAAAIGMAVGIGGAFMIVAFIATLLGVVTLAGIRVWVEPHIGSPTQHEWTLCIELKSDISRLLDELSSLGLTISGYDQEINESNLTRQVVLNFSAQTEDGLTKAAHYLASRTDISSLRTDR